MQSIINVISAAVLPVTILMIILYGIGARTKVYDVFVQGAWEGMKIVVNIMPTLVGLLVAVGVLRASSFFEVIGHWMEPLLNRCHMALEVFSLSIVKMFSSSASTGLLLDVYRIYGTDSFSGLAASLMMSSTETIFYTMSVYFMAAHVTKTRYTLVGALIATLAGTVASFIFAGMMAGGV